MSPMSIYAVQAAVQALQHAAIDPASIPQNLRFGCILGSTTGSPQAITQTYETLLAKMNTSCSAPANSSAASPTPSP